MSKNKDLYTSRYMDIQNRLYLNNKEVILTLHAIKRARKRDITAEMIEAVIRGGKMKKFGKNFIRITKRYKRGDVTCIVEDVGEKILIRTISLGKK